MTILRNLNKNLKYIFGFGSHTKEVNIIDAPMMKIINNEKPHEFKKYFPVFLFGELL